jgi:hypothetical protein
MFRNSTQYVITGSKFYRLSSRSILGEYGTNLQNIEKSVRKMYWADDGKVLNQYDQAGAEALIVAYLTKHGKFRDLFIYGIKPHTFVGLHLFKQVWKEKIQEEGLDIKCDIDELCSSSIPDLKKNSWWKSMAKLIQSSDNWTASERYYYLSKQVCHSSNYGVRANMFCLNTLEKSKGKIVIKKKDAEFFLETYHGLFPEIKMWHAEIEKQLKETRILFNLFGNPIQFTGSLDYENTIKEGYSAIPQSTVACITNLAFIKMQNFIEDSGVDWDLLGNCHDSFVVQCPDSKEEIDSCQRVMKQFIEPKLVSPRGEEFSMKGEGSVGRNWAPFHETKNPEGLKEYAI